MSTCPRFGCAVDGFERVGLFERARCERAVKRKRRLPVGQTGQAAAVHGRNERILGEPFLDRQLQVKCSGLNIRSSAPCSPLMTPAHDDARFALPALQVAAGLVFRRGLLLITQRPAGGHLAGLWEFPGGKREPHESFESCLQRELIEELGIEVEVRELVESVTHAYPEKTVHVRFFRCCWRRHEPQALGCSSFRWVGLDELGRYDFPPADGRLLEMLRTSPQLWQSCPGADSK